MSSPNSAASMPLGHRHADRGRDALAERPGRGLDARRHDVFRVARRLGPSWRKRLSSSSVIARDAGEVEQRVEQHRAVAGRQHEAVAIGPVRIGGVEFQELREQHRRHVGRAHRQAGMAGLGLLDRVHGENADGVGQIRVGDAVGGSSI